ncbi:MAG TPA: hypothetical protein DHN29_03450 [Cytophagales bacterium]|nr:hypothetical protein [Cytophagales bacterium]
METSQSWIANVEILNSLLRKESWYNTFFAKFSGNVDISNDDNGNKVYSPSGKPIEILNSFIAEGRDNMLIPFLSDLNGSPVYGDTVLKGTGEDQAMKWLRSFVNQFRKAVMKKSGSMSEQRQKVFKLYDAARPQLARWFTKWENQAIFQTFYEGASPNLTTGTASDGLGLARRYHPNWYEHTATGVVTTIGTAKTFKTNAQLDAALGLTAGADSTADTALDSACLRTLRVICMSLKIPQMTTKNGNKYWCLVVHPAQMKSLQDDGDYETAQRYAFSGSGDMPEMSGVAGYYGGFAIYEDIAGIREWDEAGYFFGSTTSARFDASEVTLASGTSRCFNAVVFGNSSIGKGVAQDLHFTNEVDDHENTIEIGGAVINGYNRNEYVAEGDGTTGSGDAFYNNQSAAHDAAALSAVNQSSLILATKETV